MGGSLEGLQNGHCHEGTCQEAQAGNFSRDAWEPAGAPALTSIGCLDLILSRTIKQE